jgi:hypothetical protein
MDIVVRIIQAAARMLPGALPPKRIQNPQVGSTLALGQAVRDKPIDADFGQRYQCSACLAEAPVNLAIAKVNNLSTNDVPAKRILWRSVL